MKSIREFVICHNEHVSIGFPKSSYNDSGGFWDLWKGWEFLKDRVLLLLLCSFTKDRVPKVIEKQPPISQKNNFLQLCL
jgi:hypothetical protein